MESRVTSQCVGAQREITAGSRRSGLRRALVRTMSLGAFLACIWAPSLAPGQQGAAPSAPCGWCGAGNTENNNNFNTIFDWVELAWTGDGSVTTMGGNTTEVDMFGLPLLLALAGTDPVNNQPAIEYAGFRDK